MGFLTSFTARYWPFGSTCGLDVGICRHGVIGLGADDSALPHGWRACRHSSIRNPVPSAVESRATGEIQRWLDALGLGQYAAAFEDNDIDRDTLPELDHALLKELGVRSVGHRVKLLKAIAQSRSGNDTTTEPGPSAATQFEGAADADRRQLTVMFCDLVGSTELSQRLDPEDLRDIMQAYQETVTRIIGVHEGFVARYMGDGVLAYFGYPQAHDDDATRAVRAALALTAGISGLTLAVPLAVRIGIATGPVVVGDLIGAGASEERAVAGVTPNLAARLQGLADAGETVVDVTTRNQSLRRARFRARGERALKGFEEQIATFAVIGLRDEVEPAATPMLGRIDRNCTRARGAAVRAEGGVVAGQTAQQYRQQA